MENSDSLRVVLFDKITRNFLADTQMESKCILNEQLLLKIFPKAKIRRYTGYLIK